jgi:hypothetical protein
MAENSSNNSLFYNSLIQGLLRPEAQYKDAYYLNVVLPADGEFEGATGYISDYPDFLLNAARSLRARRRETNVSRLLAGNSNHMPEGLSSADRRRFLKQGMAFIDVELYVGESHDLNGCLVGRPMDLASDNFALKAAMIRGLEPIAEEPFVYDSNREIYVPDPFEEPHLRALYRYLNS